MPEVVYGAMASHDIEVGTSTTVPLLAASVDSPMCAALDARDGAPREMQHGPQSIPTHRALSGRGPWDETAGAARRRQGGKRGQCMEGAVGEGEPPPTVEFLPDMNEAMDHAENADVAV